MVVGSWVLVESMERRGQSGENFRKHFLQDGKGKGDNGNESQLPEWRYWLNMVGNQE